MHGRLSAMVHARQQVTPLVGRTHRARARFCSKTPARSARGAAPSDGVFFCEHARCNRPASFSSSPRARCSPAYRGPRRLSWCMRARWFCGATACCPDDSCAPFRCSAAVRGFCWWCWVVMIVVVVAATAAAAALLRRTKGRMSGRASHLCVMGLLAAHCRCCCRALRARGWTGRSAHQAASAFVPTSAAAASFNTFLGPARRNRFSTAPSTLYLRRDRPPTRVREAFAAFVRSAMTNAHFIPPPSPPPAIALRRASGPGGYVAGGRHRRVVGGVLRA